MKKYLVGSIFVSIVLLLAACSRQPVTPGNQDNVSGCPEDAKICADGSSVVRSGSDCQFAPCPQEGLINISSPSPFESISSPVTITGEARGPWFFEASFPVQILDGNGQVIAEAPAMATEEWMTEGFVPFEATLEFDAPATDMGTIVFRNDNPSGLPENSQELRMPISFVRGMRTVQLYYYNPAMDRDDSGNILCSRQGLVIVERQIPITKTPIQDTINLLLSGNLTATEKTAGITTEYPLEGLSLKGASLKDGALTLEFSDPSNKTVGGSCRVGVLWSQIEATAKQFPEVKEVRFLPEEMFQP